MKGEKRKKTFQASKGFRVGCFCAKLIKDAARVNDELRGKNKLWAIKHLIAFAPGIEPPTSLNGPIFSTAHAQREPGKESKIDKCVSVIHGRRIRRWEKIFCKPNETIDDTYLGIKGF